LLRRLDVDWKATLAEWSNYDLDSVEREIQEEKARRTLRRLKTEGTPLCPRCSGRSIFTGNEKPDGRWIKRWKHHFLCTVCRISFYRPSEEACDIKVGEEGDDDAKEPQE